jgi:hypothetical protein
MLLVASNGICLLVSAFILVMKLLPRARTRAVSAAIRKRF